MLELDILKWAAGSVRSLTQIDAIDTDILLAGTRGHHLAGHLLSRLRREPQTWATSPLLDELVELKTQAEQRVLGNIEAMREILGVYSSSKEPLITIKGYSVYLLTGDRMTMQRSADIDVVCSDPEYLVRVLYGLGYADQFDGGSFTSYAVADMFRGDTLVDGHRYMPVYSFPNRVRAVDFTPAQNPGAWNQTIEVRHSQVRYPDLLEYSVSGVVPGTEQFLILNPNMAVFLSCIHIFSHGSQLRPDEIATVKLGELAQLNRLIRLPAFKKEQFLELVERFDGYDSVGFVGDLMNHSLGFNPLPALPREMEVRREVFVGRYSEVFWASSPWTLDDLLIQQETGDMRSVVDHLGANTVTAGTSGSARAYSAASPGKGEVIERVITLESRGKKLPIEFYATWGERALILDVSVMEPVGAYREQVRVDVGDALCLWTFDGPEGKYWLYGDYGEVKPEFAETGYSVRVVFPWELLGESPEGRGIPAIITASKLGAGWNTEPLAGTLIPLNIVRA